MDTVINQIGKIGIVPVIAISDIDKAVPLADALADGGVPCAEITFRTDEGEKCIRRIATQVPDILVGAGTVLSIEQVDRAIDAGAKFLVSPGFNINVVKYAIEKGIPMVPGCVTPSEMEAAMDFGIFTVKFFPAEQAGGLAYIKAVSAPYTKLSFMPTGGINADNLGKYMAYDRIVACGASWLADKTLIAESNFGEITSRCKQAVKIVKDARNG